MCNKKIEVGKFNHCMIYRNITESHAVSLKEINYYFPLYLYSETNDQQIIEEAKCFEAYVKAYLLS
jgi:hypothetical protein